MNGKFGKYYIGLDMGTNSLGWAVTDLEYQLKRAKGKALWGVRLFDTANTASDRRLHRASRRRTKRRVQRIDLLQELFAEELGKIDPEFFQRLNDSALYREDKSIFQSNSLFNDKEFKDEKYHDDFKTIYHLRRELIENKEEYDIRLVYLALHHIIKNRGHFLFEGMNLGTIQDFNAVYDIMCQCLEEEYDLELISVSPDSLKEIIKNQHIGKINKEKQLKELFKDKSSLVKGIASLLSGKTVSLHIMFSDEELKENEHNKISFENNYDEYEELLASEIGDKFNLISRLRAIYNWGILSDILNDKEYISIAKVDIYDKHKKDLELLKYIIKKYAKKKYFDIFRNVESKKANYCNYVKVNKNKNKITDKYFSQEDFCKEIAKVIENIEVSIEDKKDYDYLTNEITLGTLLPKQTSKSNGVIPAQVHEQELKIILENASKYLKFLNETDDIGLNIKDKILKVFKFKIPYYVGPLNGPYKNSEKEDIGNCWVVRKKSGKIYPWNFEEMIDLEASGEKFIRRMTNKCTYLIGKDVIPKNSLLYSKFMVLNELNNLKINEEKISVELKQKIYEALFKKTKKVTMKGLKSFLTKEGIIDDTHEISGIDQDFKASLQSYIDFKKIIGDKVYNIEMVENIINWIGLFSDDKKLLRNKISSSYSDILNEDEIKEIMSLKYTGWGRLSRQFLEDLYYDIDENTGECMSIIAMMWNTNNNLMQLLSSDFKYLEAIEEFNNITRTSEKDIEYDDINELYVSPAVKRAIWQTIKVVKEIKKVAKNDPEKIFIEVAREEGEKKRTISRRDKLLELYKSFKKEERDWKKEIEIRNESDYRQDKLYLYYTQMGRCMYTNESIDLSSLFSPMYDIDHIYPRSLTKDDSLNNKVLVKKEINADKSDSYPITNDIQTKMRNFWTMLLNKGFINKTKYDRLIRKDELTEDELSGFIARQLVETRQSSKAVAHMLEILLPNTEIVYVKARNVSDFRHDNKIIKVRELNDYHHANDAYLNIVVGNVYNTKFTKNPRNFIKNKDKTKYNLTRMFEFDVKRGETIAWIKGENGTIKVVNHVLSKNNILITRMATEVKGAISKQLILKKGKGQLSIKGSGPLSNIDKYGGYDKVTGSYFMLVKHMLKGKEARTFENVPLHLASKLEGLEERIKYCIEVLELKEVEILIPKIKINTLMNIDGFNLYVSGRTDDNITFKNANQLIFNESMIKYLKKVIKIDTRSKQETSTSPLTLNEKDEITLENNIKLYDEFLNKITNTVYNVFLSAQEKTLKEKKEDFITLGLKEQCQVLTEILNFFQCNSKTVNLGNLGGGTQLGKLRFNKNIINKNTVYIINQSITGLYEEKVDLLKL